MLGRLFSLVLLFGMRLPAAALTIYKYTDANGVVTYTDQDVAGAQVFVFRDRMVERLDLSVKLETKKHEAGETLLLRNELFAPVEVELRIDQAENVSGGRRRPREAGCRQDDEEEERQERRRSAPDRGNRHLQQRPSAIRWTAPILPAHLKADLR